METRCKSYCIILKTYSAAIRRWYIPKVDTEIDALRKDGPPAYSIVQDKFSYTEREFERHIERIMKK